MIYRKQVERLGPGEQYAADIVGRENLTLVEREILSIDDLVKRGITFNPSIQRAKQESRNSTPAFGHWRRPDGA
jgi:hypothetical protein